MIFHKKIVYSAILISIISCEPVIPDEPIEANYGSVFDKVLLTPIQSTYLKDDVINIKASIPSVNNYFGLNQVNLFDRTNDNTAKLTFDNNQLFLNNEIEWIIGTLVDDVNSKWIEVPYNSSTGKYEFEINVKLNKIGSYSFYNETIFEFNGNSNINKFILKTNILANSIQNNITFNVQP